jgi:hypothetical protein
MYGRITYADQKLIINQQEISGVINFDGSFEIPYENLDVLGGNFIAEIQGDTTKNISINRFLIQSDPLKYLTGDFSCNGHVSYNNLSYGFTSGYMTNYIASCSIGEIANIQTDFLIYGNIGGGIKENILPSQHNDNIYVANYGNIFVNASEGQTNRIVGFNYSVSCERVPLFVLGSDNPSSVFLKKPLIIDLSLEIEIDDYESADVQTLICSPNIQNISIELKNCDNTQIIETFTAPNSRLISNSYVGSTEDSSTIELSFRSFVV